MTSTSVAVPAANGNGAASTYLGGQATVVVQGTFDGGTVKLQVSYDSGTTWIDAASLNQDIAGEYIANGGEVVWFGGKPQVRANLSGSGGSTDVTCELHYGLARTRDLYQASSLPEA